MPNNLVLKRWAENTKRWTALAQAGYDFYCDAPNTRVLAQKGA